MQSVKVHPDLSLAALRQKRDREYRLWSLCRTFDTRGCGRVHADDFQEWLDGHDLRGLSSVSVRRLLTEGEGVFWTVYHRHGQKWIRLHGLESVCVALEVGKLKHNPVLLPMRCARSLKSWRAAIYASMFGDDFSNPISRRTIETLTGKTPRAQRYYQTAMSHKMESRQNATYTGQSWQRGDDIPEGCFPDYVDGQLVLLKRLPNSYKSELHRGQRGMMRRVNSKLNARKPVRICGTGEQRRERLFYSEQRAAHRRIQAMDEGDQFIVMGAELDGKPVKESRCGAVLYSRWTVANGQCFFV